MNLRDLDNLPPRDGQWIAAIDTSSDRAGVALFDGVSVSVISWDAHRQHTVDTLAELDHLLRLARLTLADLSAIAVATGPGSFSALRVGLSIGKGLAFSLGLPLVGVATTEAIAASVGQRDRTLVAVMSAGRGRVVWNRYAGGQPDGQPQNTTVTELLEAVGADALVVGEIDQAPGLEVRPVPAGARVEQVARIGWERFRAGATDDPALLEPIYVHGRRPPESIPA